MTEAIKPNTYRRIPTKVKAMLFAEEKDMKPIIQWVREQGAEATEGSYSHPSLAYFNIKTEIGNIGINIGYYVVQPFANQPHFHFDKDNSFTATHEIIED